MNLLFASAEIVPLAKTGGLADVSGALPAALAALGIDVQLAMPGYTEALDRAEGKQPAIPMDGLSGLEGVSLIRGRMPDTGLPIWLVDYPALYRRPGGLYVDEGGNDRSDNCRRFATFARAVAQLALGFAAPKGAKPDIVHVSDWHLGLVPALLALEGAKRPPVVFTIHNLAFLGLFPAEEYATLGLPPSWYSTDGLEFYGQISLMKAGIRFADRLTTVSPRYAEEIMKPEFGCGLDGLLRKRAADLTGILNGIDYERWTPSDPQAVPFPYNARDFSGKRHCKAALQAEAGLEASLDAPLVGYISRLTEQKMADVLPGIMPDLAAQGAQLIVCGSGDRAIEGALQAQAAHFPGRVTVRIGYDEALVKRILAGADILAAPARFEPCGLVQMYAMRYGTVPVVRRTGGLKDSVIGYVARKIGRLRDSVRGPAGPTSRAPATGFLFDDSTAEALSGAITDACSVYRTPITWRKLQMSAMKQDFRWRRSAERYRDLYLALLGDADRRAQASSIRLEATG